MKNNIIGRKSEQDTLSTFVTIYFVQRYVFFYKKRLPLYHYLKRATPSNEGITHHNSG